MSYNIQKYFYLNSTDDPDKYTVTTTYAEIAGSKGPVSCIKSNSKILYKYSFNCQQETTNGKSFVHVKLQKSNDNFSSNALDIDGCHFNVSADTSYSGVDIYNATINVMFVVDNDSSIGHLRLMIRKYSSSNTSYLHKYDWYDEDYVTDGSIYYNPTLMIMEI